MSPQRDDHPVFSALSGKPLGALEAMTERRIEQARADGLFDNLPGAGEPIPDIDVRRRPGWFADRLIATERNKLAAYQLEEMVRKALPSLWRLPTEQAASDRIGELNELVDRHNRAKPQQPVKNLDLLETMETWRRLGETYAELRAPL